MFEIDEARLRRRAQFIEKCRGRGARDARYAGHGKRTGPACVLTKIVGFDPATSCNAAPPDDNNTSMSKRTPVTVAINSQVCAKATMRTRGAAATIASRSLSSCVVRAPLASSKPYDPTKPS